MYNSKKYKHNSKQNKHKNTWFSTPEKARNPGHANHVLKNPQLLIHWIIKHMVLERAQ